MEEPSLLHLNRHSVAGGFALGLFVAFIPVPGQMLIAAAMAILLRVNLVIAVASVWITNPVTMPPIFYFCYRLGIWLMGGPISQGGFEPTLEWFWVEFDSIWRPLMLGSIVVGSLVSLCAYVTAHLLWRLHIVRAWQQRHSRRRNQR